MTHNKTIGITNVVKNKCFIATDPGPPFTQNFDTGTCFSKNPKMKGKKKKKSYVC